MKKILFSICLLMVGCLGSPTPRDPTVIPGIREKKEERGVVASCSSCTKLSQELISEKGKVAQLKASLDDVLGIQPWVGEEEVWK